ncbi:VOC family protein [Nocardioides euryhalodurans]|uniref:VOC family protein n=1 Tax=Nocardioides euryhalodurans TaxID=2518370 RepID=A0A4P7GHK5_9ACTN|nr:VOC family protein [Nocardioides euryhalodurans]QBR91221.1 VOC family protein [Nocardioides euryhalodurans]
MVRIGAVVLNVSDRHRAASFWSQALGYAPAANPDFLVPAEDGAARLHLDETDRTHLDLWVDDAEEQDAEVERLVALGARQVEWDYPDDADFVVLADPDGNLFCVIDKGA